MTHTLLTINASSNPSTSTSRKLSQLVQQRITDKHEQHQIIEREVSQGLPLIDAEWIAASYTAAAERNETQKQLLALSGQLIQEIKNADEIIIATPMYNFSVPGGLKAWIDLIARVGETFHYTDEGPQGLVASKPVTLIISTGGVPVGSEMDYVSPYLKQVLSFIGLTDINIISAEGMNVSPENSLQRAHEQIDQLMQDRAQAA